MTGGIYALIALAFVLIYKSTGVFNLAQGEMLLIPALVCWSFLVQLALPVWLAFVLTIIVAAVFGLVLERLCMRPLLGQSVLVLVMMTIAASKFLRGTSLIYSQAELLNYPLLIPLAGIHLGPLTISTQHLLCFLVSLLLFGGFMLFFRYTNLGLGMRAVAEEHQTAQGAGLNVKWIFSVVWVIAAIISAVGGYLLGSINGVNIALADIGLKALPAALLGGLDSIIGAVVGGLIIGVLEGLACGYLDPIVGGGMGEVFPFIVMILILLFRPYGLFGLRRIERV